MVLYERIRKYFSLPFVELKEVVEFHKIIQDEIQSVEDEEVKAKLILFDEYFKKNVLKEEEYYIYNKIMEGTMEDLSTVEFQCSGDCTGAFYKAYYALYLDHPELISFLGIRSYRFQNNTIS